MVDRVASICACWRSATYALACLAVLTKVAVAQQPFSFNYIRKETREESRLATLAQYFPSLEWEPWHLIGPFNNTGRNKHDVSYPPEREINFDAVYIGKLGREVRWQRIDAAEGLPINFLRFGSDALNYDSVGYVYREVRSMKPVSLVVNMGSDDGLKFWFNGELLVNVDTYRGLDVMDHTVTLHFKAGVNTMLVKVTNGAANWEFQMKPRMDSRILAQLNYHLNRDFPAQPEYRHYMPLSVLEPEGIVLEVGGLDIMPDGRPILCTRRGDVWIVEGAYDDPPFNARFKRFAFGLHEPLGARWHDGGLLVVQRGELTKLIDEDGDDRADVFQTVSDQWGISGNYHEFAFGPKFDGHGRWWVTLNVGFCGSLGKSIVPWRGWAMIVNAVDGTLTPVCGGLRSPNGLGRNAEGDMFYTDNQGDWVGTNKLSHLDFGDWHGHPSSFQWYPNAGMSTPNPDRDFKQPAVWFPYDRMGRSASDIALDTTGGGFGPFENQLFVGDQFSAEVFRVFLERVEGVYQGACFGFLSGLDSGVNRIAFAPDGSMFVGMTNRGWWSFGPRQWGLQRIVYSGLVPFEVKEMRIKPDGFELVFTKPVDRSSASNASSYAMASFTYERFEKYGSPEIDRRAHAIRRVMVSDDGLTVQLVVDPLRETYVHELRLAGIRDAAAGEPLLHDMAYYTVNVVPR